MPSTQVEVPEVSGEQDSLTDNPLIHDPEKQLSSEARAFLAHPKRLYIAGQFIDAADGEMFETEELGTKIYSDSIQRGARCRASRCCRSGGF
jgi:hypothetical protein